MHAEGTCSVIEYISLVARDESQIHPKLVGIKAEAKKTLR